MIYFSLNHILESSPYDLVLSGNNFMFQTDLGVHYVVGFDEEDIELGGCATYQLIIHKVDDMKSPHDPKVEQTILAIIEEFFRSNLQVMLYLCDTSDGREQSHNRLFLSWFERYMEKERFTICRAHAEVEGEGLFLCVVVDNRNPRLTDIISDFNERATLLTGDKP